MGKNRSLQTSREKKDDEYYTRMPDIENELSQYDLRQFNGKIVYCNCDDPTWSNFFKFFVKWGTKLKLSEVHFTNYSNKNRKFIQCSLFEDEEKTETIEDDKSGTAHHWIFYPKTNKIVKKVLTGNGDFRSKECLKILDESDIVVTNPPFSLLTEFLGLLISKKKKFLVIGNENEIASRSWCRHFTNGDIWLGYTHPHEFLGSLGETKKLGFTCWYTNLEVSYRNTPMILHPQDISSFEKYDNYDAIEIPKVKLIPENYKGNMGVPIFFIEKFCPSQFEIVDTTPAYGDVPRINGIKKYRRIIIRRK